MHIINSKTLLKENSSFMGQINQSDISILTYSKEPFLFTEEALLFGSAVDDLNKVLTISEVTEKDCLGHFGPKFSSGPTKLMIPLLLFSRAMSISAQIAARLMFPEHLAIPIGCRNVRANKQNLLPPPASIVAEVNDFQKRDECFFARTLARAKGESYAEAEEAIFKLVPLDSLRRRFLLEEISKPADFFLEPDYRIIEEIETEQIEKIILERRPFHNLEKALLAESSSGDLKVITISEISRQDCEGQLVVKNNTATVSFLDYSKAMALAAEMLASIVTRRNHNLQVVPIAVKVEEGLTPEFTLFSPPTKLITEAKISSERLRDPRRARRGNKLFWVDSASVWVRSSEVARFNKITYALIPEELFWE